MATRKLEDTHNEMLSKRFLVLRIEMKLHDSLHNSVTTFPTVRLTTMSSPATRTVHFIIYIYFVIFCSIQIGQIHYEILGYATLS